MKTTAAERILKPFSEALLYALLFFAPVFEGGHEPWAVFVIEVGVAMLVMLWGGGLIAGGERGFRNPVLSLPVVIFIFYLGIRAGGSVYAHAGWVLWFRAAAGGAVFLFVINNFGRRAAIERLGWAVVVSGGLYTLGAPVLFYLGLEGIAEVGHGATEEFSFTFANHSHFSGYLEMVVLITLGLALSRPGRFRRTVLLGLAVLGALAVFSSLSRGGLVSLGGGLAFFLLVYFLFVGKRDGAPALGLVMLGILAGVLIGDPAGIWERASTLLDPGSADPRRLVIWRDTVGMISVRPLLGFGLGSFICVYPRFQSASHTYGVVNHAHNDYLELAAEAGLLGLGLAAVLIVLVFYYVLSRIVRSPGGRMGTIALGALSAVLALLIHSLFDFNLHIPSNALLFSVSAGLAVSAARRSVGKNRGGRLAMVSPARIAAGAAMVGLSLIAIPFTAEYFLSDHESSQAQELTRQGELGAADAAYARAMDYTPGDAGLRAARGDLTLIKASRLKEPPERRPLYASALFSYERAVDLCPPRWYYHQKRAFALRLLGRKEEALVALKRQAELAPSEAMSHYDLGTLALELGKRDLSEREFRRFLELSPNRLPMLVRELKRDGHGPGFFEQIVPSEPDTLGTLSALLLREEGGDWREAALRVIERAYELDPTGRRAAAVVKTYSEVRGPEAALEMARALEDRHPDSAELLSARARLSEKLGRNREAAELYSALIETEPDEPRHYENLYRLLVKLGKEEEAEAVYRRALDSVAAPPVFHYTFGRALASRGRLEAALLATRKLSEQYPLDPQAQYLAGLLYERMEIYENARLRYERCLELSPEDSRCRERLDRLY